MLSPHVRDSMQELKRWTLIEADIMHEFLDQIEAAPTPPPGGAP